MGEETRGRRVHERWAHLRFSVVGQLLAAPPGKGELKAAIEGLAARTWRHPTTGEPVRFGFSTIERWYYRALRERADPVTVLRRKLRADAGQQPAVGEAVRRAVLAQYAAHKSWSVKLHHDNLVALAEAQPGLGPAPSYPTLLRFMRANGLDKRRRLTPRQTEGAERAEARLVEREVRRYEAEYVNGLWHWDCHHGSRKVLTARGEWVTPILFGVLDDRSRLACHLQWYLSETAEVIAHGLAQAFQKRGLPRAALERQRLGDDGGRDQRRPRAPRRPAPHDPSLFTVPKCETGGVLGPGRGPARRHAGARARPDAGVPQRGDAGLGRARVQPHGPLRDRRRAARPLPRRAGGDAALSGQRRAPPRLHPQRHAHAEEERRQHRHRRPTLRAAEPLSPSRPRRGALRRVGPERRPPRRRAHRRCAGPPLSAGQDAERQRPAPLARAARRRRRRSRLRPPASPIPPLLKRLLDAQSRAGLPPAYLPKDEDEGDAS